MTNPEKMKGSLSKPSPARMFSLGYPAWDRPCRTLKRWQGIIVFAWQTRNRKSCGGGLKARRNRGNGRSDYPNQINNVLCFPDSSRAPRLPGPRYQS